jgi:hypothetical protein
VIRYLVSTGAIPSSVSKLLNLGFSQQVVIGFGSVLIASSSFIAWDMVAHRAKRDDGEAFVLLAFGLLFVHVFFMLTIGLLLDALVERILG